MKKIWMWLNGNKTIITGILWGAFQTSLAKKNIPPDILEVCIWASGSLAALSGVDHIRKGYFSTKVGNPGQTISNKNPNVQP